MKINLLICDWFEGLLPPFVASFPQMFVSLFAKASGGKAQCTVFDASRGQLPQATRPDELYVITGAMASAYDNLPWISLLKDFIRQARADNIALAGVCFGHQLIAQALGGSVERSPNGWGAGIRASKIVATEALRYFPEGELRLFYNHNDQVVRLPEGATRIATSSFCTNEAYTIGKRIVCFQGHPEYTAAYERHVLSITSNVPPEVTAQGYATTAEDNALSLNAAQWMLEIV